MGQDRRKEEASVSELEKERYPNKDPKGGCRFAVHLAACSSQDGSQLLSEV